MNIARFLEHWSIVENPFRAEEARHDPVFARLAGSQTSHPDFEKILGDPARPATSVVFGEKGSGKTAIRLQIADSVRAYNEAHPQARTVFVAHDDLNPMLDRFAASHGLHGAGDDRAVLGVLQQLRLVDHMDAILHDVVAPLMDQLLGLPAPGMEPVLGEEDAKKLRRSGIETKRDVLLLAALYDREDAGGQRLAALRGRISGPRNSAGLWWKTAAIVGALLPLAVLAASYNSDRRLLATDTWRWAFWIALGVWACLLFKHAIWDLARAGLVARRVKRQLRSTPRTRQAMAAALAQLPLSARMPALLPVDDSDEARYAMFARLRRVLLQIDCRGIVVVFDRLDEPSLVNGDAARMRAIVWPLLNNKFLQQENFGLKLLLPLDLRHELFRESAAFFQEARLDKQNLVERLSWTGPMLFDLCKQRLNACRTNGAAPISLVDLFAEDVARQDLVDALDQMHQPRDAFKLLYQCIQEHCSNVTEEQEQWRIPRLILDTIRKQQSDRVQMFSRGARPA